MKLQANVIEKLYWAILDIFFPKLCLGCGRYGSLLCFDCAKLIDKVKTDICPKCGKISENGRYCTRCRQKFLSGICVAAKYDSDPTKELIHHLKYSGFTELAEPLAELIVEKITVFALKKDFVIVPVPLHRYRESARGFNQSELLARHISKRLGLSGGNALERMKNTESQIKFTRKNREKNVSDIFRCIDDDLIRDSHILLVDDVSTTGATLIECAKTLKLAGAKSVYGAVVARNIK